MNILNKIPGSLLVLIGAICLSFGGIIVKSFEGANLWQILFWRQFFFSIIVALYLIINYKKNFFKAFYISGLPGFIPGFCLSNGRPPVEAKTSLLLTLNFTYLLLILVFLLL